MSIQKREITILAIVLIVEVVMFILNCTKLISCSLGPTIVNTFLYFSVCYLYVKQISANKWRISVVVISLSLLVVIISSHLYIRPQQWFRQCFVIVTINVVATQVFILNIFTHDQFSTVLFTSFTTEVFLLFNNRQYSERWIRKFTIVVSIMVYILLSIFHVKQIWDKKWKVAAIASIFVFAMVLGIILSINWNKEVMLFAIIASINTCLSLVPWLLQLCAPKIKAWWQFYHEQEISQEEQYNFHEMTGLLERFTIKELEIATRNFQELIGEGASGAVFKGILPDASTVAVKRIKWQPSGETEFRTEMAIIVSRQHVNLVRLLGFSLSPRGDRYLIYPFFEKGSLDAWLFANDIKRSHLTWMLRYGIAVDLAKALAYLHNECHQRILHLDIKPANILLDVDFRALLSDFGISKLIGKDESCVMTKARGTVGYFAPEMLVANAISTKCDIYSYGMVLFELVGGRRNLLVVTDEESQQKRTSYFPKIVREKMLHGDIMEVVDKCLVNNNNEIREEEVTVLTRLALWCIQDNPTLRPDIKEVVEILEGHTPVRVPPESSMFIMNFLDLQSECSISCQGRENEVALMSANNFSISIHSGR